MVEVYQFRVYLREISPAIWRRLLLRSNQTIADLHYTLQIAMGWSDLHLNRFVIHGKEFGVAHIGGMSFSDDPHMIKLSDFHFRLRERFLYEYDFGDRWEHEIRLEKKLPVDPKRTYPVCPGGSRNAPPEDCGGPIAFQGLESHYSLPYVAEKLWEIIEYDLRDEYWEELHEFMYWLTVNEFDRRAVNHRLKLDALDDDEWCWP
jgi:hypothetical protein